MEKTYPNLAALFLITFLTLFFAAAKVHAVQGELNYGFQQSQEQVVVEDTKKLSECNDSKNKAETLLKNCQDANQLFSGTQKELKNQKNTFMLLAFINGGLAIALGIISLLLVQKNKKKTAPPA